MNVFAINGSARMEKGNTALILAPFLEGMEGAGAKVELFYAKKLNVSPWQPSIVIRRPDLRLGTEATNEGAYTVSCHDQHTEG